MRKPNAKGKLLVAVALCGCASTAPAEPATVNEPTPETVEEPVSEAPPVPLKTNQEDTEAYEATPPEPDVGITDTDFELHVAQLKARMPKGFKIFVERPFVVIGNESKQKVRQRATGTVRWTIERLKYDYFPNDPDHIIDIWLFRDGPSYRKYAMELFGDKPDTPYGYYSENCRAIVMNIGTGAGTLVHEIVHPFMAANFPDCPAWFNGGMGSLYEHSTGRGGHICWSFPSRVALRSSSAEMAV